MESTSSDEEDCELPFWNNWLPPVNMQEESSESDSNEDEAVATSDPTAEELSVVCSISKDETCVNWVPPNNFQEIGRKRMARLTQGKNVYHEERKKSFGRKSQSSFKNKKTDLNNDVVHNCQERRQLHDIANLNDGDLIWGIVNLGVFSHIKLWINEYNNTCALAEGIISKLGSVKSTFISITSAELLRKMLGLSTAQWASLCETMQEAQTVLKFDAFEYFPFSDKTALEKLWFFICKRRHLLPDQCMLVKLCGAVKCMKKLQITPKWSRLIWESGTTGIIQTRKHCTSNCHITTTCARRFRKLQPEIDYRKQLQRLFTDNMYTVNSILASAKHKELPLLGLFSRRLPITQLVEPCHVAASVRPRQEMPQAPGNLPCLPVQPLDQMLDKYIRSVRPFVDPSEFNKTKELVKGFCENENLGKKLQKLLEERAKTTENWLADWWLQSAYLEYRNPVPIYSSPALVWPRETFTSQTDQVKYAAFVIKAALDFNKKIEENSLPQEKLGKNPLCMSQYGKLFGTCRIPKLPRDELMLQDPQNPSRNIIVMYNNHFYNMTVFKENKRESLTVSHLYTMLKEIVEKESEKPGLPVGILTSDHRDKWAKAYEELKKDARNKHILEKYIEKALFVICLDKPMNAGSNLDYGTKSSKLLLHGNGNNAGNRWYDKTVQFVVGANQDGVGIVYEHSPSEAGTIGVLTDFILSQKKTIETIETVADCPKPEKLEFVVSDAVAESISSAGEAIQRLSNDLDVCGWSFTGFGKNLIKTLNVSPDSFIQIAIQLAFYRLHNQPGAQYESGSLRKFVNGRTDTIRSCSEEVVEFCKAATSSSANPARVAKALRLAIDSHKNYVKDVIEGRGVDRHLLALKILAQLHNLGDIKLFSDVAYKRSTHFQLSTSNVPTAADGFMIYGPLVDDGYACCYNPRANNINFGLSAWNSCESTRLSAFRSNLEQALTSMRTYLTFENSKL